VDPAGTAPRLAGFGFGEILVVGVVALLVYGGRLPEVMRNLGRAYARFRQGLQEVARPIHEEFRRLDAPRPKAAVAPEARAEPPPDPATGSGPAEPPPYPHPPAHPPPPGGVGGRGVLDEPPPV
jgi:sec-independent protein translocase protein TatA